MSSKGKLWGYNIRSKEWQRPLSQWHDSWQVRLFRRVSSDKKTHMWDENRTCEVRLYLQKHRADFPSVEETRFYNCEVTREEITRTIENPRDTSPAKDLLSPYPGSFGKRSFATLPWFLRNAGEARRECVIKRRRAAFRQIAKPAKDADVVPLQKPGKDHTKPGSHCPTSLLLVSSRILESIIHKRMYWRVQDRCVFPQGHCGAFQTINIIWSCTSTVWVLLDNEYCGGKHRFLFAQRP